MALIWKRGMAYMPIHSKDISGFKAWVSWHGFSKYPMHDGFDFAAYIDKDDFCILGLPAETPVRAVADGKVIMARKTFLGDPYVGGIEIEHAEVESKYPLLSSSYYHIVPLIKEGTRVQKGQIIGKLFKDEGSEEGRLVHLHLELAQRSKRGFLEDIDPAETFPELSIFKCVPEERQNNFIISNFKNLKGIKIANFKKLRYGGYWYRT